MDRSGSRLHPELQRMGSVYLFIIIIISTHGLETTYSIAALDPEKF